MWNFAPVIFSSVSANSRTALDSARVAPGCCTITQRALPSLAIVNSAWAGRLIARSRMQAKASGLKRATVAFCRGIFTPHSLAFCTEPATQNATTLATLNTGPTHAVIADRADGRLCGDFGAPIAWLSSGFGWLAHPFPGDRPVCGEKAPVSDPARFKRFRHAELETGSPVACSKSGRQRRRRFSPGGSLGAHEEIGRATLHLRDGQGLGRPWRLQRHIAPGEQAHPSAGIDCLQFQSGRFDLDDLLV